MTSSETKCQRISQALGTIKQLHFLQGKRTNKAMQLDSPLVALQHRRPPSISLAFKHFQVKGTQTPPTTSRVMDTLLLAVPPRSGTFRQMAQLRSTQAPLRISAFNMVCRCRPARMPGLIQTWTHMRLPSCRTFWRALMSGEIFRTSSSWPWKLFATWCEHKVWPFVSSREYYQLSATKAS